MTWKDRILNSDAGRSSPREAQELINQVELNKSEVVCILPAQKDPSRSQTISGSPVPTFIPTLVEVGK